MCRVARGRAGGNAGRGPVTDEQRNDFGGRRNPGEPHGVVDERLVSRFRSDAVPQVTALGGPLTITTKARATRGSQVQLTVQANGPLRSGLNTIAAGAITWTSTGAGFVAGTLSAAAPVTVGTWIGSGSRSGTQTLMFQNLWTYASGTCTASLTYTLSAP